MIALAVLFFGTGLTSLAAIKTVNVALRGRPYVLSRERDDPIERHRQLGLGGLAKLPAGGSYGNLRLDPAWDSLRGDPRFEKIVASLAVAVRRRMAMEAML